MIKTYHAFRTGILSGPKPWWKVDLGAPYDVYQVVIVNLDIYQCNVPLSRYSSYAKMNYSVTPIHIE